MKREFLQNLKVGDQPLTKEVIDAIMEENGKDIESLKHWQEKYNQALSQHQQQLAEVTFQNALHQAIAQAKGRSAKAITALLDVDALKGSEDQPKAIEQALESLKKENSYLFDETQTPPPYARGTGATYGAEENSPVTLAGALRLKYERK